MMHVVGERPFEIDAPPATKPGDWLVQLAVM